MCLPVYNGGKVHCRGLCSGIFHCMCYKLTMGAHLSSLMLYFSVMDLTSFSFCMNVSVPQNIKFWVGPAFMLLVWEVWLVQEDTWFADSDMARKLDIGCGFTYCTVCCDTSIAWEHALSPGTKEFVCAVWQRDEQYQDCWQAVGHGVLTGSGAWCVDRQWGMVCWQAVRHGMLTGSGAWCAWIGTETCYLQ